MSLFLAIIGVLCVLDFLWDGERWHGIFGLLCIVVSTWIWRMG